MFWAIELVSNPQTRELLAPYGGSSRAMTEVVAACTSNGLLPFAKTSTAITRYPHATSPPPRSPKGSTSSTPHGMSQTRTCDPLRAQV